MRISSDNQFRAHLFGIGLLAGLCAYIISEILPDLTDNKRLVLFTAAFSYAGFLASLLLAGALGWRKIVSYVIPLALVTSGLLLWASFRFEEVEKSINAGFPLVAFAKLVVLPLPFFMAYETAQNSWQDYPALFQRAWGLFVKAFTACVFVGVFWGVMWTSAYLLSLVGLNFLKDMLKEELVWMPLNGGMFGMALAVLHEMETVVDTLRNLVVRLLRLLLPIVVTVTAIFLAFVPIRGLEDVFGNLSAAGTVLWMAVIAVTLITASLDATDEKGTQNPFLLWSTRALAVLLPIMAGIAAYALYLRVHQYGWTPSRLLAVIGACVMLGYAVAYAFAALIKGAKWRDTIRQANIYLALVLIGLSILWLTPVLNAERIAANTQVKRYFAGKTDAVNLPLWEMHDEWGLAGKTALEKLKKHSESGGDENLTSRLARLETADSKYSFNRNQTERNEKENLIKLQRMVRIVPVGTKDADRFFDVLSDWEIESLLANCNSEEACILLVDDFLTEKSGQEAMLFQSAKNGGSLLSTRLISTNTEDSEFWSRVLYRKSIPAEKWLVLRAKILAGEYRLLPSGLMSLEVGNERITPIEK